MKFVIYYHEDFICMIFLDLAEVVEYSKGHLDHWIESEFLKYVTLLQSKRK